MSRIWKLIFSNTVAISDNTSKQEALKAFQRLWIAGTLGAFFTAFARNLPEHLRLFDVSFNGEFTVDLLLRYSFLFWFLAYFFISHLNNEHAKDIERKDIVYDVVQSGLGLATAFVLGFIPSSLEIGIHAFVYANGAIFLISIFAHALFSSNGKTTIEDLRIAGAIVSLVCIIWGIWIQENSYYFYIVMIISQLFMWRLLFVFFKERVAQLTTTK